MDRELLKNYDISSSTDVESIISESFNLSNSADLFGPLYHSGYLLKKPDGGTWHRRYFETNGSYLTYYKSNKMKKLLAAVHLPEVGDITLIGEENDANGKGFVFKMQIRDRIYLLRAESLQEAEKWISVLTTLRDNDKVNAMAKPKEEPHEDSNPLQNPNPIAENNENERSISSRNCCSIM